MFLDNHSDFVQKCMPYVLLCTEMYIISDVAFFSGVETRSDCHVRDVQVTGMGAKMCKGQPEKDILVVMVGSPAHPIDLTASVFPPQFRRWYGVEVCMQDTSQAALDFDAVRRSEDPIVSIHDQGAGGNVLKEMPNRSEMAIHNRVVGDPTMWGVLQEDADPREGLCGADGGGHRGVVGDGQDHIHGPHGGEGQQDGAAGAEPRAVSAVGGQQALHVVPDEQGGPVGESI